MSTRIHPSSSDAAGRARRRAAAAAAAAAKRERWPAVYTVWKRSSMGFQGTDGFCVYDDAGRLAFRVDNYSRRRKLCAGELLLMDGKGTPLLSLRPQLLSLHDRWNCYTATEDAAFDKKASSNSPAQQQVFTMSRCSALRSSSDNAEVHMSSSRAAGSAAAALPSSSSSLSCKHAQAVSAAPAPGYRVEGSFSRRSCKIRHGSDGREAAQITRKSAGVVSRPVAMLGDDVFSLVVQPGVDVTTVMAIVVVMDRICRRPYTPMVCSSQ
ncbi:protein LURP-one-related 5-like [Miscanthus floridulus]|uniref:protein LURP-one-related 5-like n=1 Tax=Miscanthus floridulus TaxID=154761 RepID=UPI00345AD4CD